MHSELSIPVIGVVAQAELTRNSLRRVIQEAGYSLGYCGSGAGLPATLDDFVQVWLIDTCDDEDLDVLEKLASSAVPVLINDAMSGGTADGETTWRRRLIEKLDLLAASQPLQSVQAGEHIEAVWILAASLGGPDAVAEFLRALPAGLPIALIYAQHIEAGFEQNLASALGRQQGSYHIHLGHGCNRLLPGHVIVVPKEHQVRLLAYDQLVESRQPWEGRYQPAIDQVVAEVARTYRKRAGMIVFTGTCDDGAIGARVMTACGGEVWVQNPYDCLASAMPEAVLAAVPVKQQGNPEQLAQALAARYIKKNYNDVNRTESNQYRF
jgi:chemosensory pili system protein ChpB (putative protein-glutamate methylesterase)